jgi:hypothetical protein
MDEGSLSSGDEIEVEPDELYDNKQDEKDEKFVKVK